MNRPSFHSVLTHFSLVMAALMGVLPFLVPVHRPPFTAFHGGWLAAALGVAALALLLRRHSWQPLQFPVAALVPLGLALVLGMQVALGQAIYWQHHFLGMLYLLWATMMTVLGAALRREFGLEKMILALAWAIIAGALASTAMVAMQAAGVEHGWLVSRKVAGYGANLAQVNHLADYLALGLASLIYLTLAGHIRLWCAAPLALAMLFPLALTGQRMGWMYIGLLALAGGWFGRRLEGAAARRVATRWLPALIPAFFGVQWLLQLFPPEGVPMMPTMKVVAGMQGPSLRWQLIQEAWQIFLDHPWLGAGFGQFGWHDFLLSPSHADLQFGYAHHAHNLIMQLLAETGLAGALVMVAGMVLWMVGQSGAKLTPERLFLYAGLAILGVHSLLEYPLWYGYFLGLGALLAGAGDRMTRSLAFDFGPVVAAAGGMFGGFVLWQFAAQYEDLGQAMQRLARPATVSQRQADLERLAALSRRTLVAPAAEVLLLRALPKSRQMAASAVELSHKVVRYWPSEAMVYDHATWLALAGHRAEALRVLRCALSKFPGRADAYAVALMQLGDAELLPLLTEIAQFNRRRLKLPALPATLPPGGVPMSPPSAAPTEREKFPALFGKVALAAMLPDT